MVESVPYIALRMVAILIEWSRSWITRLEVYLMQHYEECGGDTDRMEPFVDHMVGSVPYAA